MAYPLHVTIEPRERYSRLTTFFRLILLIPHAIVLALWSLLVFFTVIAAWFAIVFTARYPRGLFDFHLAYLSYSTRFNCYAYLLCDGFPPFGGGSPEDGYPIQVSADYPERLSRLKVGFRFLLVIPATVLNYFLNYIAQLMALVAWFVVIFTGRIPDGLYEVMVLPQRYAARVSGYGFLLLTDTYPWFQDESDSGVGPVSQFDQPLPPPAAAS